jgi:23S rRNA pseudouridine2605 synthase
VRLNRYLSQCGIASRRGAEQIISEGRVSINGHIITNLATQVEPDDKVIVDGKPVQSELPVVLALNKPKGYLCSRGDTHDRMTIYDLLPERFQHLHHVGRLDKESEGLLLMTNRGDLSHRLIHPSMGAEKEYEVVVNKPMSQETMARLVKGMPTEEGHAKAERAWMETGYRCHVVLKQGLKRQIRLMFYYLGFEVERLTRTRIGWLNLRHLQKGGWKELKEHEVKRFFEDQPQEKRERPRVRKTAAAAGPAAEERPRRRAERSFDGDERPRRRPAAGADREERPRRRPAAAADHEERPRGRASWKKDGGPKSGPKPRPKSSGAPKGPRGPRRGPGRR